MASQTEREAYFALLDDSPIFEALPKEIVEASPTSDSFIPIPNALNIRSISSPPHLPPGLIFRSGSLSNLPLSSLLLLKDDHNITTIFDLRSRSEREHSPTLDIPGIETIWVPGTADVETVMGARSTEKHLKNVLTNIKPADFVEDGGEKGFIKMYENVLETHRDAYKAVFERLRDGQGGVLFHCTAGKDRTGVLAAIILAFVEAPNEVISQDYLLTRVGVEPFREFLLGKLVEQMGREGDGLGLDTPGLEAMCGVRSSNILAFLKSMDEKWGKDENGTNGYLTQELGLTKEDLDTIRGKLRDGKL